MILVNTHIHFYLLLTYFIAASWVAPPSKEVWMVHSTSNLRVDGKTNVNQFDCVVSDYKGNDSLVCYPIYSGGDACRVNGSMLIPIAAFDCHHRMMTKDLQKTLKMEEHPSMRIDFKNFSHLPSKITSGSIVTANAEIRLAGVSRKYNLMFQSKNLANQIIDLKASQPILFSEFNLTPPSKLGGTIRVKDELQVVVSLQLRRYR